MRRAVSVLLLSTLLAPLFPVSTLGQEVEISTPTDEVPVGSSSEEVVIPLNEEPMPYTDGVSTTPQLIGPDIQRAGVRSGSFNAVNDGTSVLYHQVSSYTSNGTVAIGVRSLSTFEYQAGVSYTPSETQAMGGVSFVIGRSGERTGHIHAEVWHNDVRIAVSEDRDVKEFLMYGDVNVSQEAFESALVRFNFTTPVVLQAGENYQIVAGANSDLSGYLDTWVSFTAASYPVVQQQYDTNRFREILNANFILHAVATTTIGCVEACLSNVMFLPGIEGSALKDGDNLLWPSNVLSRDGERLRLTETGESINDIKVAGVIGEFVPGVDVYGEFAVYMDDLVENKIINEWTPFPYDWRLALDKILMDGVEKEGGSDLVRLSEEVERLAATSKSGKVTIVAHSMGGLIGKLLIKKLETDGKAHFVDNFIMVGTPQLGTPEAIAALLHGEQPVSMGLFMRSYLFRSIARNMRSAYALLPSKAYFEIAHIPPVITFDTSSAFTQAWRSRWGASVDSASELDEFLSGTGITRVRPNETNLAQPEVLISELLGDVDILHDGIDAYTFPSDIRVVQIAGWGLPTVKTINYKKKHIVFDGYEVELTREGDKTVIYTSALSSENEEKYFFNLFDYNDGNNQHSEHRDLTSTGPVQSIITSVLRNEPIATNYISTEKPNSGTIEDQLLVATKSPVVIGAYDAFGNFTGINPSQNLNSESLSISENIPGSSFLIAGEDMYLFLPNEGSYTFTFKGTGTGPATVEIGTFSNDVIVPKTSYSDIPVTTTTKGSFSLNSSASDEVLIEIDSDEDGTAEFSVAPDGYTPLQPTIEELILNLKFKIEIINIPAKLKANLLKLVEQIEKKIEKQKSKKSKILEKLESTIVKKEGKGKIDVVSATDIVAILDELESHTGVFPLDLTLIQQLRIKIVALNAKPEIAGNLHTRVERLEKIDTLSQYLVKLVESIVRKAANGKITDADTEELLKLLEQIKTAL